MPVSTGDAVYGQPDQFAADMRRIINDAEFSDITFIVGETREKINAHRVILAARCEVFRAMFAEQKAQAAKSKSQGRGSSEYAPLVLPDVHPNVFLTVLEFIYSNSCSLVQSSVVDVLASAIEYGLDGLADCCSEFITKGLNVESACQSIQAAIAYNQNTLRDDCMDFIEANTAAVFRSSHFAELSHETLAYILQSDRLQVDEAEVLRAVKEWASVNAVVGASSMAETLKGVIEHVRFPLLSASALKRVEEENEREMIIPVRLIAKAWKYQATKEAAPNDPHFKPRAGSKRN